MIGYDSNLALEETGDFHDPDLRKSKFESTLELINGPPPLILQTDFASFQLSLSWNEAGPFVREARLVTDVY